MTIDAAAAVFFGTWLLLTAVRQFGMVPVLKNRAFPRWLFFAPRPAMTDHYLAFRDRTRAGTLTEWRDVAVPRGPFPLRALWNPQKRLSKVINDACRSTAMVSKYWDGDERAVRISIGYLTLVNYFGRFPAARDSVARQFGVVQMHGLNAGRAPVVVLQSEFHPL